MINDSKALGRTCSDAVPSASGASGHGRASRWEHLRAKGPRSELMPSPGEVCCRSPSASTSCPRHLLVQDRCLEDQSRRQGSRLRNAREFKKQTAVRERSCARPAVGAAPLTPPGVEPVAGGQRVRATVYFCLLPVRTQLFSAVLGEKLAVDQLSLLWEEGGARCSQLPHSAHP